MMCDVCPANKFHVTVLHTSLQAEEYATEKAHGPSTFTPERVAWMLKEGQHVQEKQAGEEAGLLKTGKE